MSPRRRPADRRRSSARCAGSDAGSGRARLRAPARSSPPAACRPPAAPPTRSARSELPPVTHERVDVALHRERLEIALRAQTAPQLDAVSAQRSATAQHDADGTASSLARPPCAAAPVIRIHRRRDRRVTPRTGRPCLRGEFAQISVRARQVVRHLVRAGARSRPSGCRRTGSAESPGSATQLDVRTNGSVRYTGSLTIVTSVR